MQLEKLVETTPLDRQWVTAPSHNHYIEDTDGIEFISVRGIPVGYTTEDVMYRGNVLRCYNCVRVKDTPSLTIRWATRRLNNGDIIYARTFINGVIVNFVLQKVPTTNFSGHKALREYVATVNSLIRPEYFFTLVHLVNIYTDTSTLDVDTNIRHMTENQYIVHRDQSTDVELSYVLQNINHVETIKEEFTLEVDTPTFSDNQVVAIDHAFRARGILSQIRCDAELIDSLQSIQRDDIDQYFQQSRTKAYETIEIETPLLEALNVTHMKLLSIQIVDITITPNMSIKEIVKAIELANAREINLYLQTTRFYKNYDYEENNEESAILIGPFKIRVRMYHNYTNIEPAMYVYKCKHTIKSDNRIFPHTGQMAQYQNKSLVCTGEGSAALWRDAFQYAYGDIVMDVYNQLRYHDSKDTWGSSAKHFHLYKSVMEDEGLREQLNLPTDANELEQWVI